MGDKQKNTGYIKVTDLTGPAKSAKFGYHTVPQEVSKPTQEDPSQMVPWSMPQMIGDGQDWEFVDAAEVREHAPQILEYNPDELSDDEIAEAEKAKAAPKAKA